MNGFAFSLSSPGWGVVALLLAVGAVALVVVRRPALARLTLGAGGVALGLLVLAVAGLTWHRPAESEVVVMVDLSASTRGATYRDRDELQRRIGELLGSTPHREVYFSDHNSGDAPGGKVMGDMGGEKTVFAPPAAAAVLLFSDGRFELPEVAAPVYAVADPELDQVKDAGVSGLRARGEEIEVKVQNAGGARRLTIEGAATRPTMSIDEGTLTIARPMAPGAEVATAQFDPGDAWPENDALSVSLAGAMRSQKWLVARGGAAPAGKASAKARRRSRIIAWLPSAHPGL